MKKKSIIGIVLLLIIAASIVLFLLDNKDFIQKMRILRDSVLDIIRSTERTVGIPLKAKVMDTDFVVEEFITGLNSPTSIAFIGNEIFILEKNEGKIRLIQNGILQKEPILDVEVSQNNESGMLGITTFGNDVYVYFTEANNDGGEPIGNNIYKYTWNGKHLVNPQLVNSLLSDSPWHNGGAMISDQEGNVFAVIGDQMDGSRPNVKNEFAILQNFKQGEIDDSGVIIRVGIEPSVIKPKTSIDPLNHYFAVGIRNSFGLVIDPLTGSLWDTENGPDKFDEINLVSPKFNSGWAVIMGPARDGQISQLMLQDNFSYSDPEFSWERTVTPTGLDFANSENFKKYYGELFVGSCNFGQIFKFELNEERTGFVFSDEKLVDLVANQIEDGDGVIHLEPMNEILFGTDFGCITDVEFGPDGILYVVSISDNIIYRIFSQ